MDRNIRIAKELIKLARSIAAVDDNGAVADKEGEYKGFTGKILWKGINGEVENADFHLNTEDWIKMAFISGTWRNGTADNSHFDSCDWKNGTAIDCDMNEKVVFENGTFSGDRPYFCGIFKNGTFDGGMWVGNTAKWVNGTWNGGWVCESITQCVGKNGDGESRFFEKGFDPGEYFAEPYDYRNDKFIMDKEVRIGKVDADDFTNDEITAIVNKWLRSLGFNGSIHGDPDNEDQLNECVVMDYFSGVYMISCSIYADGSVYAHIGHE